MPIKNQAILNIKKNDMFRAIWSILANLYPITTNQNCTTRYKQYCNELDITCFDFSQGLRIEGTPKLETENSLNLNVFEVNYKAKDDLGVTSELLPFYISDSKSKPIEILWYENHYCLIKKLHVFIGNYIKPRVCRSCMASFFDEYWFLGHQINWWTNESCLMKFPRENWLSFKPKNCNTNVPFRFCCDFECLNARVEESVEKAKTQIVFHQWPIAPGYYFISELPKVLKLGYHENFGLCNVEWFVD